MSGGGDVIGDIAQGALTARALEPTHGEAAQTEAGDAGHTHESACLNCGTPLVGTHCHACGQAAHVHRTIRAFFHDLLHGVFHFEGKIWRTLPLLAWKPGLLTREYIDGRRASYVSPIALFLFVVFLTFAVFNALGSPVTFTTPSGKAGSPSESLRAGFAEAERQTQGELERLEARLAVARKSDPGMVAELEGDVADTRATLETLRGSKAARLPGTVSLGDTPQERALSERFQRVVAHARENPELLIYKLQNSAYKFSWMLIPLSVPFLWLLFPFSQRFHLYDHTVFVTYSLSFMLILLAVISALTVWGGATWLVGLLLLYAPYHMYRQLRGTYALGRTGAALRTVALSFVALTVLMMFGVTLGAMALAG